MQLALHYPSHPHAAYFLGTAYTKQENYEKGAEALSSYLRSASDSTYLEEAKLQLEICHFHLDQCNPDLLSANSWYFKGWNHFKEAQKQGYRQAEAALKLGADCFEKAYALFSSSHQRLAYQALKLQAMSYFLSWSI